MFAANISTVHLVSFAETAYKYGLVYGNFEWMAGFTLILLSLFFAPLYLRSRVPTLPDFLERRFNRHCRDWLTIVSIFSAIVIHIGVALYTAALVLRGILGIDPGTTILGMDAMMFFIIVLAVLTGIYTMIGGLLAVVWTESIQTVLLADRRRLHHGGGLLPRRRLVGIGRTRWPLAPIRWPKRRIPRSAATGPRRTSSRSCAARATPANSRGTASCWAIR